MTVKDTREFEELTINSLAGLQAFLKNAQAQFNFGVTKETELMMADDSYQSDDLHHVFQTLKHTTNKLIAKVQHGEAVTQTDASALQGDYDELVRVVEKVEAIDIKKPTPEQQSEPHEVEKKETQQSHTPIEPAESKKKLVISDGSNTKTTPSKNKQKPENKTPETKPAPQEVRQLKPKTGALTIASDTSDANDAEDRVSIDTKNLNDIKQKKETDNLKQVEKDKTDTLVEQKIKAVVQQSQSSYHELQKKYPKPNVVQILLFDEVREGIEHLELLAKRAKSDTPLKAVSEVASHIKYALEGIEDEAKVEDNTNLNRVPIVTRFTSQIKAVSGSKKELNKESRISYVPTSITTTKPSVARRTVASSTQVLPRPDDIYKSTSLTELYLSAPKYQRHIMEHYTSPAGFEQLLDATITKIEADTIDSIERWLGDLPASAFAFLADMSLAEFSAFANRKYEQVQSDLRSENIKYETFAVWRDLVNEMEELVQTTDDVKFGQLFTLWMAELDMKMSQ